MTHNPPNSFTRICRFQFPFLLNISIAWISVFKEMEASWNKNKCKDDVIIKNFSQLNQQTPTYWNSRSFRSHGKILKSKIIFTCDERHGVIVNFPRGVGLLTPTRFRLLYIKERLHFPLTSSSSISHNQKGKRGSSFDFFLSGIESKLQF